MSTSLSLLQRLRRSFMMDAAAVQGARRPDALAVNPIRRSIA
jgi:hypothetical protein